MHKSEVAYAYKSIYGHEVYCIVEQGSGLLPIEIKEGMTFDKRFIDGLVYWQALSGESKSMLVYGGNNKFSVDNCAIKSWKKFTIERSVAFRVYSR